MDTYELVLAVGTTDQQTRLTTFTNRPDDALGLVEVDENGAWLPVPQAALLAAAAAPSDAYTKAQIDAKDQVLADLIATVRTRFDALVANADPALDVLVEIGNQLRADEVGTAAMLATLQQLVTLVGTLPNLNTTAKTDLVSAINEVLTTFYSKPQIDGFLATKATKQEVAALAGRYKGAFLGSTQYYKNDVVTVAGLNYAAKADFVSASTFSAANWNLFGAGLTAQQVAALTSPITVSDYYTQTGYTSFPDASDYLLFNGIPGAITLNASVQSTKNQQFGGTTLQGNFNRLELTGAGKNLLGGTGITFKNVVLVFSDGAFLNVSGTLGDTEFTCMQLSQVKTINNLNANAGSIKLANANTKIAIRDNSLIQRLTGTGTAYIYDNSTISYADPTITIVDRRAISATAYNVIVLDGSTGTFSNATGVPVNATSQFAYLPLATLTTNYVNSWDTATNRLRIPISGTYLVSYNVLPENSGTTASFIGHDFFAGPATGTAADSPDGKWQTVNASLRASASGAVTKHYNAGDLVGLAHFQDSATFNILCSLTVILLKAD
jgi:hypothetical protein